MINQFSTEELIQAIESGKEPDGMTLPLACKEILSRDDADISARLDACYMLALINYNSGQSLKVIYQYVSQGIDLIAQCRHMEKLPQFYLILGQSASFNVSQAVAVEYFRTAEEYVKYVDPGERDWMEGILLVNIGYCYRLLNDSEKALKIIQDGILLLIKYQQKDDFNDMIFNAYIAAGHSATDCHDFKAADACMKKAEDILQKAGKTEHDQLNRLEFLLLKEHFLIKSGHEKEADESLNEITDLLKTMEPYAIVMQELCIFITALIDEKKYAAAGSCLSFFERSNINVNSYMLIKVLSLDIRMAQITGKTDKLSLLYTIFYATVIENNETHEELDQISMNIREESRQLRKENQLLSIQAEHDQLTGLPNRYHLTRTADHWLNLAIEKQISFGLEIMDIDFFKQCNDNYGHQTGDLYLKETASVLYQIAEEHSEIYVSRYGGDEFMILYLGLNDAQITTITQKINDLLREKHLKCPLSDRPYLTVTQGICNCTATGKNTLLNYMTSADHALYTAKEHEKGTIEIVSL